jgi:hypothetical protein
MILIYITSIINFCFSLYLFKLYKGCVKTIKELENREDYNNQFVGDWMVEADKLRQEQQNKIDKIDMDLDLFYLSCKMER